MGEASFDVERYRAMFPGLRRRLGGRPAAFLDGPAGSQVPHQVIDAMADYLTTMNANGGGRFATSRDSDALLDRAHAAVADFLGADDADCVVFGPNMTTLTLHLSRALARTWRESDEVIVTRLDHDANFTPWVLAARDAGATVREIGIHRQDCTLDVDELEATVNERTVLVAVTAASNAVGSLTPVRRIADAAHRVGARLFVDGVHYAAHRRVDVAAWDCDFLACSPYKFFGPHQGVLWGRRALLEALPVYKLRPASDDLPGRWMTGTQSHEGIAGTMAAVNYLADLGRDHDSAVADRRAALDAAYRAIGDYERGLTSLLLESLGALDGVTIHGITDPARLAERVGTVSFTREGQTPAAIAERLGDAGVFVWHGNYYALPLTEALGLEPEGMVRVGLLHYNTAGEVERLVGALG